MTFDPKKIQEEIQWLLANSAFDQKPASITEFIGPDYLNIEEKVRPGLKKALVDIFGKKVNPKRIGLFERAMVTGAIGIGKQLSPDEMVLTPTGWTEIHSLSVGDKVIGRDGHAYSVTNTTRWNNIKMYRMTFKDGTWIDCGAEHLWTVRKSCNSYEEKELTLSTEELAGVTLANRANAQRYYSIPQVEPVWYEPVSLELDPYLMGQLLGDGCLKRTVTLASADLEIEDYFNLPDGVTMTRRADGKRWGFTTGSRGGNARVNPMLEILRSYGLMDTDSYTKFIPRDFMFASIEDRSQLLRGIMDADGTVCASGRVRYGSANQRLANEVADLVRSLGGYASVTSSVNNKLRSGFYYELSMSTSFCPFNLERKVAKWENRSGRVPRRYITSITQIDNGPGVCISVDAPDKLYVTKNFIVTHNTTFASISLPYMAHWVLCLRDPQDFFGLLPGSRIAFMQMSTSEKQASEVVFGDIFARIENSKWFIENYPHDDKFTKQIRFPKDIWILPGDSSETSFEGYNILAGILDEMDSHKITQNKDYADVGFDTIHSRIASRFTEFGANGEEAGHKGLLICIGQMKKGNGFAARKYKEFLNDSSAYVMRMTIWESFGWSKYTHSDGKRNSFWYDIKRKSIIPKGIADNVKNENFIEIPNAYVKDFKNNPEKALRDLAGIPPASSDPFISLVDRIESARDRWVERYGDESPVKENTTQVAFQPWFKSNGDPRRRHIHIDLATSGDGDALGMAMGHIDSIVEVDDEKKPYIIIDCLIRIKAMPGTEIMLSDVRRVIYELKEDRNFRVISVSTDGFQSTDTQQQLRKKKYQVEYLSVDKSTLPYEDLREAIYEQRIEFPPYKTYLKRGDTKLVEIAIQELQELQFTGKKVDHPEKGSKDLADAMAGVASTLMGDRSYRRGVTSIASTAESEDNQAATGTDGSSRNVLPFPGRGNGLKAPIPPSTGFSGLTIPSRLRPR